MSLASGRAGTRNERRCAGIKARSPASRLACRGCRLAKTARNVNVAVRTAGQRINPAALRKLIALRKSHPTLISGKLHEIQVEQSLLRFRRSGAEEIEVVLNMTHESIAVSEPRGHRFGSNA